MSHRPASYVQFGQVAGILSRAASTRMLQSQYKRREVPIGGDGDSKIASDRSRAECHDIATSRNNTHTPLLGDIILKHNASKEIEPSQKRVRDEDVDSDHVLWKTNESEAWDIVRQFQSIESINTESLLSNTVLALLLIEFPMRETIQSALAEAFPESNTREYIAEIQLNELACLNLMMSVLEVHIYKEDQELPESEFTTPAICRQVRKHRENILEGHLSVIMKAVHHLREKMLESSSNSSSSCMPICFRAGSKRHDKIQIRKSITVSPMRRELVEHQQSNPFDMLKGLVLTIFQRANPESLATIQDVTQPVKQLATICDEDQELIDALTSFSGIPKYYKKLCFLECWSIHFALYPFYFQYACSLLSELIDTDHSAWRKTDEAKLDSICLLFCYRFRSFLLNYKSILASTSYELEAKETMQGCHRLIRMSHHRLIQTGADAVFPKDMSESLFLLGTEAIETWYASIVASVLHRTVDSNTVQGVRMKRFDSAFYDDMKQRTSSARRQSIPVISSTRTYAQTYEEFALIAKGALADLREANHFMRLLESSEGIAGIPQQLSETFLHCLWSDYICVVEQYGSVPPGPCRNVTGAAIRSLYISSTELLHALMTESSEEILEHWREPLSPLVDQWLIMQQEHIKSDLYRSISAKTTVLDSKVASSCLYDLLSYLSQISSDFICFPYTSDQFARFMHMLVDSLRHHVQESTKALVPVIQSVVLHSENTGFSFGERLSESYSFNPSQSALSIQLPDMLCASMNDILICKHEIDHIRFVLSAQDGTADLFQNMRKPFIEALQDLAHRLSRGIIAQRLCKLKTLILNDRGRRDSAPAAPDMEQLKDEIENGFRDILLYFSNRLCSVEFIIDSCLSMTSEQLIDLLVLRDELPPRLETHVKILSHLCNSMQTSAISAGASPHCIQQNKSWSALQLLFDMCGASSCDLVRTCKEGGSSLKHVVGEERAKGFFVMLAKYRKKYNNDQECALFLRESFSVSPTARLSRAFSTRRNVLS